MRRAIVAVLSAALFLVMASPAQAAWLTRAEGFALKVQNVTPDASYKWIIRAPYLYSLPSGAGWVHGDRWGQSCAFTFLRYHDELVARVLWVRLASAQSYVRMNDLYMGEQRNLDGSLFAVRSPAGCPDAGSYDPLSGSAPLPVITFDDGATRVETRNYASPRVDRGPDTDFRITGHGTGAECDRRSAKTGALLATALECVTVTFYYQGLPVAVSYYDRLSDSVQMAGA